MATGWRIEVTTGRRGGRYWQWRRGSKEKRESKYGGKFNELGEDRQAEYWQFVNGNLLPVTGKEIIVNGNEETETK